MLNFGNNLPTFCPGEMFKDGSLASGRFNFYSFDSVANFATGENLIIATFGSALNIIEIEEFLNMNERAFIIFEMLPATFSANLILEKFQKTLFGGKIDNSEFIGLFNVRNNMEHTMKKFSGDNMEGILEELQTNIKTNIKQIGI